MAILTGARAALARWIGPRASAPAEPPKPAHPLSMRSYGGAAVSRLTSDWTPQATSADSEIITSLRQLRARSRQMLRDNEYALRAQRLVQNNVIGQGVGMQAQVSNARGKLQDRINTTIEDAWARWAEKDRCHTGGTLAFADIERLAMGELFAAGEVLLRLHPVALGDGNKTPLSIEVIEADRLIDQWSAARTENGNLIRMGVECDQFGRPQAYWLHPTHPGDYQFTSFQPSRFERVPADQILHIYLQDRHPQTRGVPWLHATLRRLRDIGGYSEAEIVRARASASVMGFLTTPEVQPGDAQDEFGNQVLDMEPGVIKQLLPGQSFTGFDPSTHNAAMEPFMRLMLRGIASGVGVSYESLSRDFSQSNYSSSRLSLLDDRDLWRVLQSWWIRNVRMPLHRKWLEAAVLGGDVIAPDYHANRTKWEAVRFRPRGWSWVDPTKEVASYIAAVQAGFMTVSDVIGATGDGRDLEDVLKARRAELDLMAAMDLQFSTAAVPTYVGASAAAIINAGTDAIATNTGEAAGPDAAPPEQTQEAA